MQKESYKIFVDNSGSVGGCQTYWQTVQDIIIEYGKDITHYYFWNSRVYESSKKQFEESIASKRGTGGTSPSHVAENVANNKFVNIILVTDGEVGDSDVKQCDQILETALKQNQYKLGKAICYVIGGYSEPNLSVTCPFTRYCESKVFSRNGNRPLKAVMQYTAQDYKVIDNLDEISLDNFEAKYDTIEQLIIALNMGKDGNLPLKNQLVALKTRLVKELSKRLGKKEDFSTKVRNFLEAQNVNGALEMVANMAVKYFEASGTSDLEGKIAHLISLCGDMRGQYNVDQIKSNKMATAQQVKEGKLDQTVETEDLSKNPIECPIIMDEDVPQILVDECEPFLLGVEKCIVDDINACPLRLLNYPALLAKFKSRLSTFTGVKYSDKMKKNPFTQNRLLGAIPLGTHKSHIAVGNHTIAKLVSGGKAMGNLNMYLAVIWYLVNQDQIEFLKPIKANVTEHLFFRLKTTKTMASMCGLSQFVATQINGDIALWYCVNSGFLNQPTEKDTFRFHLFSMDAMVELVTALGYPIHSGFKRHYLLTKALFYFLDQYKRSNLKQRVCFKNLFKGLYQKGFIVDTSKLSKKFKEIENCSEFIPVDGPADEEQVKEVRKKFPKFCEGLTNEELFYVSGLLKEDKDFSEIFLDYNTVIPALPAAQVNWVYGLDQFEQNVRINPETLHPQFEVEGKSWDEVAKKTFKVEETKELFKGCRYIEDFIVKHKKQPTADELAVFYYNRYVESGKKATLPFLTQVWINDFLSQYEAIFPQGHDIKKIIAVVKANKSRSKRAEVQAESSH